MSCGDIFLGLIAVLFPPIAVWIKTGLCSADSLINILLCILGYLPGLFHAWYIIAKNPEYDYETVPEEESGRVTYYYVSHDRPRNYGTQNQNQNSSQAPAQPRPASTQPGPSTGAGAGENAPPSYADAVKGDHKVQRT